MRFENQNSDLLAIPKSCPECAGGTPLATAAGTARYKTLHSTANRRRLPGEKALQPAWTSPEVGLPRCFVPLTLQLVSALPASVGKCNPPITWTDLLHSPGMRTGWGRRTPSDRSRAETIPTAWMCPG